MAFKNRYLLWVAFYFLACSSGEKKFPGEEAVPGVYVNTYTAEVIDPETGEVIGARTVKDSLFIVSVDDTYEIANRKWLLNDYDDAGWVDSMQGEREPMSTYFTTYDPEEHALKPVEKEDVPLFLEEEKIYWGEAKALEYIKVE